VFSTLVVPSNEEEQAALEVELATVEMDKEVDLVNVDKTPILANRIFALLRICRTITLTLVSLTKAWLILRGEEDLDEAAELVLPDEEGELGLAINSIADPVGVLNDIHLLVGPLSEKLSISHPESTAALRVVAQIGETTAIIATSQLLVRSALLPELLPLEEDMGMGMGIGMGMGMDIDGEMVRRRVSMGGAAGGADRRAGLVRELEADLRGILGGEGDEAGREGRAGDRAVMRWLEGILERAFGEAP
jgi:nuclear pore complex protein Nup188